MLTGSVRHEGSSKFGKNHRWGTFWAVSGGWRISNEAFLRDVSFLDDLKVRVGYGVTGNNNFSAGASTAMYSSNSMWPYNGTWITSYGPARNVNYDLHWEKKAELNVGLDYAFLNNRLLVSLISIREEFLECYIISTFPILPLFMKQLP